MRLVSISLFKWQEENPILISNEQDLSMLWFYQRGMAQEHINFNTRLICSRTAPGTKASITLEKDIGVCYCWTANDKLAATVITDKEYPEKAAFIMLGKIMQEWRNLYAQEFETYTKDVKMKFAPLEQYLKDW